MTDREVLNEIQYALLETPNSGTSMSSDLWTTTELVNAINAAQLWVVQRGTPIFTRTTLVTVPNEPRYNLPQTWLQTRRVAWEDADGDIIDLPRDASRDSDYGDADWSYDNQHQPLTYTDFDTPVPQLQVMPTAYDNGVIHLLYVASPTKLSNTGVSWAIPDLLVPMAKWKALAILLAKDGRGQDLPRAAAANALAEQGMTALKTFMTGWM